MFIKDPDDFVCPQMSDPDDRRNCQGTDCPMWIPGTMFFDRRDIEEENIEDGAPAYVLSHSHINYNSSSDASYILDMYESEDNDKHTVDHVELCVGGCCGLAGKRGMHVSVVNIIQIIKDPLNTEQREC